jgi:WD40 repeat protein/serine/threonine protein kinase
VDSSDALLTAALAPSDGDRAGAEETLRETWKPGDIVLGLYEVREVFTSGGRGLVYRVRHRGWNMDLAVKCPRPEYFRNEQDKADFEREAETWVKLGLHTHTVNCYYVRRLGGIPRVFAEYVAGGSLAEWIRTKKLYAGGPKPALQRVLDIAIQFAWGLQHAHEQGLVHRDVKPGNVLLTAEGLAKVTDFGMAKARGVPSQSAGGEEPPSVLISAGGLTPAFCSPEQIEGRPLSRKTDIWSWGVSVLTMFAGGVGWSAGYLAGGALQIFLDRDVREDHLPAMPLGIIDLLRRCFQADAEARPKDMLEIVTVLQKVFQQAAGRPYHRERPQPAKALADSLNNRAVSLCDLHKQEEAEQLWEEALAAGPNHPEATYNLGLCRWRAGRMTADGLAQRLREVCISHPGEWLPPYLLAQIYMEQSQWRPAIDVLEHMPAAGAGIDEVRAALAAVQDRLANTNQLLRLFHGHADWVSSVCCSADGKHFLSGSADKTVKLWDLSTGECLQTLEGHTEWVTTVSLSADGRHALSGSADKTLKLWDLGTGRCLQTLLAHTNWVLAACLSEDGRYALSAGGDGLFKRWDLASGTCVRHFEGHGGPVLAVALSKDGRLVLSGSRDKTLKLWDIAGGQCLCTFTGHGDKVQAVALSADQRYALSGSGDRTVKLWETATGHCLRTFEGHSGAVLSVALAPDGQHALSGSSDRSAKWWRLSMDRCLCTLEGHTGAVNSVSLTAGGRYGISGSADKTLTLWSLPEDLIAPFQLSRVMPSDAALAAWNQYEQALAQARQAASAGDYALAARSIQEARSLPGYGRRPEVMAQWSALYARLPRKTLQGGWEARTLDGHTGAVTSVCLSRDSRYALSGSSDRTLKVWEVATGRCLKTLEGHASAVTSVASSADGNYLLSGSADKTVKLWERTSGRSLCTYDGHTDVITSVSLSADGRLALSASIDRTLHLWDTRSGRRLRILEGHADPVHSVALSADGRYAVSGSAQFLIRNATERLFTSGQLKLWDMAMGRCLSNFERQADAVTAVSLSFDGRSVLSGGGRAVPEHGSGRFSQSGELQLWDTATGGRLAILAGHTDAVTSVSLSLDGRYAVSGSTDRTLRLWDVVEGRCLRTFAGHADAITAVTLSIDGRYAVSASADRTLKLWTLDWELGDDAPAGWDERAQPYLQTFLALHTPYAGQLPEERKRTVKEIVQSPLPRLFNPAPTEEEITQALTRHGRPTWTEQDFADLLHTLGCAGFGLLKPEGVRRQLERLARRWDGPPALWSG